MENFLAKSDNKFLSIGFMDEKEEPNIIPMLLPQ
jgi:hypothetical protein